MTKLGEFLAQKCINTSLVARKSGISTRRVNELARKAGTTPLPKEIYLISLAISIDPCELFMYLCSGEELPKEGA